MSVSSVIDTLHGPAPTRCQECFQIFEHLPATRDHQRRTTRPLAATALVTLLVATACSTDSSTQNSVPDASTDTADSASAERVGREEVVQMEPRAERRLVGHRFAHWDRLSSTIRERPVPQDQPRGQ